MRWTLPNILTVCRLIAAPGVAVLFLYFHRPWADWLALSLFVIAAITDWFDGYLARVWHQESRFGAMLDPIADKAMVVIALVVIIGYSGMNPWLILPVTIILFREVFVPGLREYLSSKSVSLSVTKMAKWKTTMQMIAIAVLFLSTGLEHIEGINLQGMSIDQYNELVTQGLANPIHSCGLKECSSWATLFGLVLIWIAALLTFITGWDYFKKALPYLKD